MLIYTLVFLASLIHVNQLHKKKMFFSCLSLSCVLIFTMSSLILESDDNLVFVDLNVVPSSPVRASESENTEIPNEILNPLVIHPHEMMITNNEGNQGYFGDEEKNLSLKIGEEENVTRNISFGSVSYSKLCIRSHWTPSEDAKLITLVAQLGPQNWNNIAQHLHGRSGKSCRLRWFNELDPRINKTAFSKEEEKKLLAAHEIYGNKWARISQLFNGRTDNALKNHFHVIMARRQRGQSTSFTRKRKPIFQTPSTILNMNFPKNNVASGSTISSTIDGSTYSTSTNLNLFTRPLLNNYQASGSQMGDLVGERKNETGDMGFDKIFSAMKGSCDGHMGKFKIVDQSNYSGSSSGVSITESVATNMNNASILGESEDVIDKIKMSFIDFLGVGDT